MFGNLAVDIENFRVNGKSVVEYICKYLATIEERSVAPSVSPGYLSKVMPKEAPENPEEWRDIMEDVERIIMPGITHWQHPRFHGYFPAGNSFPSIMGDMVSDAIGCVGFSWAASPACTELEMVMLDWLAKMMDLPAEFLHSSNLGGGGVIQGSASDCILVSMLSARHQKIHQVKLNFKIKFQEDDDRVHFVDGAILSKLVGYCSSLAHSSVEKAGIISLIKIRQLQTDDNYSLRGSTLEAAIKKDVENKFIPFFVCATLGTTTCCSFDNLKEIGEICAKYKIWLHVDASYAGSSFICPEFRYHIDGMQNVNTINFNPNKFMLVNFDCSILWVRKSKSVTNFLNVDPVYLQHKLSSKTVDFRHWGIPLSRRFRALKLWFVIRSYGVEGLRKYIRNHVNLASLFEGLVRKNESFEIIGRVVLGLVCFRLKASSRYLFFTKEDLNLLNKCLIETINQSGKLHLTPSMIKDKYILRFCLCNEHATVEDIHIAWDIIESTATDILKIQTRLMQKKYYEIIEHQKKNIATYFFKDQFPWQNYRLVKSGQPLSKNFSHSEKNVHENIVLNMVGKDSVNKEVEKEAEQHSFIYNQNSDEEKNEVQLPKKILKMIYNANAFSPTFIEALSCHQDSNPGKIQYQKNIFDSETKFKNKAYSFPSSG